MYEEVLVLMPDNGKAKIDPAQENLFCEVKYFSLLITLKSNGEKEFLAQAESWLKDYKAWFRTEGYQAITLEAAKLYLPRPPRPRPISSKLRREAETCSDDAQSPQRISSRGDVAGPHAANRGGQDRRRTPKASRKPWRLGDDAADGLQWEDAVKWYTKALEFAEKLPTRRSGRHRSGDPRQARHVPLQLRLPAASRGQGRRSDRAGQGDVRQARSARRAGAESGGTVGSRRTALLCHRAGSAAKDAALAELAAATKMVIDNWPDKPEADDARIALGQASLVQGKPAEALAAFEQVNQRSLRYPLALLVAAQTHLRLMDQEQKKPTPTPKRSPRNWRPPGSNWKRASSCKARTADRSGGRGAGAGNPAAAGPGLSARQRAAQGD